MTNIPLIIVTAILGVAGLGWAVDYAGVDYSSGQEQLGASPLFPFQGGTGTSTAPSSGTILIGNAGGTYSLKTCTDLTGSADLCDGVDGGGGGSGSISTSTTPTPGHIPWWTSISSLGSVATGTLTESATGLEFDATRALIGGSSILSVTTGYGIPLTASTTNWNTFYDTPSNRITAGTGIDWTLNTLNVTLGDFTTTNLLEGTNLYWTSARGTTSFNTLFSAGTVGWDTSSADDWSTTSSDYWETTKTARTADDLSNNTTSDLSEGTNLYWTSARATSAVSSLIAATTTTAIDEGTNLYYTDIRVSDYISASTTMCVLLTGSASLCDGVDNTAGASVTYLASTTPWTTGQLTYVVDGGTLTSVATGTLTEGVTGLEFSATGNLVGSAAVLNITSGYSMFLTASGTNWNTFYDTPSNRITAGTGIDWSGNTLNGVYTAGDALTLTGEDFNFDGGATPQGELGGTWASPTLDAEVFTLSELSDVGAFTPLYGSLLMYDGSTWSTTSTSSLGITSGSGNVTKVGTPADNQIGVWTGDGTIEGDAGLTFDGGLNVTVADAENKVGLTITQNDVTNEPYGLIVTTPGVNYPVLVESTSPGNGPFIKMYSNSASPATGDYIGGVDLYANNTTPAQRAFAYFNAKIINNTAGAEYGSFVIETIRNGSIGGLGEQMLEVGAESDTAINGISVGFDTAPGVVSSRGNQDLTLQTGSVTTGNITITDGADGNITLSPNGNGTTTTDQLSVTAAFNFLGDYITNVLTWFDTKIEALTAVVLQGTWDFGGATSLELPNGTGPTVDTVGELALDTTDDQLLMADSGGTVRVVGHDEFRIISVTIASTSVAFTSGQTLPAFNHKDALEFTQFKCWVSGGTSKVMNLTDGTNDTETITCNTTDTSDTDVATNDTFTAGELGSLEFGATTGTVNYVHFEAYARITRE